jgi:hypothetical protein
MRVSRPEYPPNSKSKGGRLWSSTSPVFIVVGGLGGRVGELDICDLEIVLVCARGMRANQKAMRGVVLARLTWACQQRAIYIEPTFPCQGTIVWSRWAIPVHASQRGHRETDYTSARKDYTPHQFFFQILYSTSQPAVCAVWAYLR